MKKAKYPWQVKGEGRNNGLAARRFEKGQRQWTSSNNNEELCPDAEGNECGVSGSSRDPTVSTSEPRCGDGGERTDDTISEDDNHAVLIEIDANSDSPCLHRQQDGESAPSRDQQSPDIAAVTATSNGSALRAPPQTALRRWQSKQLAQGIIDNAINKVLGDLSFPPFQNEGSPLALGDPTWDSYLNPLNIENEGVAEAIRQQGLQRRRYTSQRALATAVSSPHQSEDVDGQNKRLRVSASEEENVGITDVETTGSGSTSASSAQDTDSTPPVNVSNLLGATKGVASTEPAMMDCSSDAPLEPPECPLMPPEELLDTAVSYAITHRGLGVLPVQE